MSDDSTPLAHSTGGDETETTETLVTVSIAAATNFAAESEAETADNSSSSESEPDDEASPKSGPKTQLDELLYPGSKVTTAESLMMAMGYSLRHCSSKEAMEDLLKLLDAHLPEETEYPTSKYMFLKHFTGSGSSKMTHFYCSNCSGYIGELCPSMGEICCKQCCMRHTEKTLLESQSYFFMLDLVSQIRDMLEARNGDRLSKHCLAYDVTDMSESLGCSRLPLGEDDLTVTFNTDGVPLFESSHFGIWPLLVQINELPFAERSQKPLLCGLWFGTGKPSMNSFRVPFVKTMNELSSQGFSWTDSTGRSRTTKVFPGPCTVDTVARCEVMQMTQFNGEHGCAWCEEPGEVVKKGKGHSRVYPPGAAPPKPRTHESFLSHARKARNAGPTYGVKGSSVLLLLSFFSFGSGFVVDYMHAVCSGFVKSTTFLWLKAKRRDAFNLRPFIKDMDTRLISLQPIWEMSRLPRSLNDVHEWKSAEWRNWLLYYSPVVLKGILPAKYFNHWMKFVEMMHYLLGSSISVEKLQILKTAMFDFVIKYQELYGKQCITYNTHLLIHLVDSAIEWGPIWGYSLYPFESMNGKLGRLVKGTRYPHIQIVDKFILLQALPKLWMSASHRKEGEIGQLFKTLQKGYNLKVYYTRNGLVQFLGKGEEKDGGRHYKKISIGCFKFCIAELDKSRRRNSYVVADGIFGRIIKIVAHCLEGHTECSCLKEVDLYVRTQCVRSTVFSGFNDSRFFQFVEVGDTDRVLKVNAMSVQKCLCLCCPPHTFLATVSEKYVLESV